MSAARLPSRPLARGPVRVREVRGGEAATYDAFVASHPQGGVLQSWAWGELRARQHWDPVRLLARDAAGGVCGAALVLCRALPVGGSLLYLPRGPVLDYRDDRTLDALCAALRRLGQRRHAVLCKIDPPVTPPDPGVLRALTARGFVIGHRRGRFEGMQPRYSVVVPLDGGADAVLARCHAKTRYNIRLAQRRGVVVRRGGRGDLATFHRLLDVTCARNGFAERRLPYFQEVWDALAPGGHLELYLASHEGEDIAAGILFRFGDKAVYAYGASADTHREVMAPYAVQWAMLRRAIACGCVSYDMTGVPRRLSPDQPGYGLYRFKRGFWPEVSVYAGEYDLPLQPALYRLWQVVEPAYWGWSVWMHRTLKAIAAPRAVEDASFGAPRAG